MCFDRQKKHCAVDVFFYVFFMACRFVVLLFKKCVVVEKFLLYSIYIVCKNTSMQPTDRIAQLLQICSCISVCLLFFNLLVEDILTENYILCYSVRIKN